MSETIDKSQLTREQRYKIGGAEYRAIDMLIRLVSLYYVGLIIGFGFIFRIYLAVSGYARSVLESSNGNGPVNPWLFSFFLSISAFNNLGLSLVDASMTPFQNSPFPLLMAAFLVLAGNTAYALLLRLIIWTFRKLTPSSYIMLRETLHYLLEHPRRCYTTLFPATQTRWLLLVLIAITVAEIGSFLALNYWLPVLNGIPWASRVLDGIFQSIATRSAGFSVVSLNDLNPGTQLVYIIAMYISVYPVAISMRNSNVYQERALGIFHHEHEPEDEEEEEHKPETFAKVIKLDRHPTINSVLTNSRKVIRSPDFFVMTQIQQQLTNEICWLIAGVFLVCVIEAGPIMEPSPITFGTIIYECVSAFGNVGASVGYPGTTPSQSAEYRTLSKLVIIVLMYRGRHRGLPAAIDRAVLLPSEQMEENEIKEQQIKRRNTALSQGLGANHFVYNRKKTN
ncbi:cation transporter [Phycomyces nitens]|nr:cation transporter [Phycomyces nitens]